MMSPSTFVNQFFSAIKDKDLSAIHEAYVQTEETYVILEGPRLATKGYEKIASGWKDFCKSDIYLSQIQWLEGPYTFDFSDNSVVSGIIQLSGHIKQQKKFEQIFRASFLLMKKESNYSIMHEHVSGALSDPYGIGDWKKSTHK